VKKGVLTGEEALRYAMSLPVTTTITGIDKPEALQQALKVAQNFQPMAAQEMQALRGRVRQYAMDGRFELYKLSLKFDNPEARLAHRFPLDMQQVEVKEMLNSEATQIVNEALDAGINFFDNAWEYHQGLSEERLGRALKGKRDRAVVMTKVCTHGREKNVAMRQLEESLTRLQTDHLDVWQIHEVIYENDPDLIFAPNGAAEALL